MAIAPFASAPAQTLDQLIAAAKGEKELSFIAGPTTFGGKKGIAEIEAAFAKRFGIDAKIRFSAGPEMNAMAARVISEFKAGGKATTDIYLGSLGQYANLVRENALEEINWSGTFSWISRPMEETVSRRGVLVYSSPRGIIYNSNLIPVDKAPKSYDDLVDPKMSQTWAGKIAVPPYPNWLVELSLIWGEERLKDFTRKLMALNGGWLRYGEEERVLSGEFPIMANIGDCAGDHVEVAGQRRAAGCRLGFQSRRYLLFSSRRAEKFRSPQSRQAVRRLHDFQGRPGDHREA